MKRKSILLILSLLLTLTISAQELTVKEMKATNDISASKYERKDLNDQACALVKVLLASPGAQFEGNVIQPVDYKTGEYWVYMTAGAKELRIKHPQTQPLQVVFKEYGIEKVSAKTTYNLSVLLPQVSQPQTQKLTINYSPADAMVLIDSQTYQGNGHIETVLPVGNHDYVIAATGYDTAAGSVKLLATSPRTINETLILKETQQSTTQQSNTVQSSAASQSASSSSSSISGAVVETFTVHGVSFNMVRVDGGTFMMGSDDSDAHLKEKPVHQVTLSTYSIGETEVTQSLWQAVMGSNPSKFKGDNLPVGKVGRKDCQKFIEKLNNLTGKRFRLPTEAEWEYAARGGSQSHGYKYSGSNDFGSVAWCTDNSGKKPHDVKTKQPNELGLYDMSGNVWEWCQDWWGDYTSDAQMNPTGPSSGDMLVIRGGSCAGIARECRSSCRIYCSPSNRLHNVGLRLAF